MITAAHRQVGMESAAISGLYFAALCGALPCHLCLMQRWAYYFVVPAGILIAVAAFRGAPHRLLGAALLLVAAALLANAVFGGYHSGVEWGLWKGPSDCTGTLPDLGSLKGGLLAQIDKAQVVPCDKVQWQLFGISLAGFNAMISAFLCCFAFRESMRCLRKETFR